MKRLLFKILCTHILTAPATGVDVELKLLTGADEKHLATTFCS